MMPEARAGLTYPDAVSQGPASPSTGSAAALVVRFAPATERTACGVVIRYTQAVAQEWSTRSARSMPACPAIDAAGTHAGVEILPGCWKRVLCPLQAPVSWRRMHSGRQRGRAPARRGARGGRWAAVDLCDRKVWLSLAPSGPARRAGPRRGWMR
jgi:hypothetical protein